MTTAALNISGVVTGAPQGTELVSVALTSTAAVAGHVYTTLSSAGTSTNAFSFLPPAGCKYLLILPPSTNTQPMRFSASSSTVADGIPLSSVGASLLSLATTNTTYQIWTTGTTSIVNLSLSFY